MTKGEAEVKTVNKAKRTIAETITVGGRSSKKDGEQ
jgi:hypothetical protein